MNFFTAEILLSVNASKLAAQLKRAESASTKTAKTMQSSMNKSFTATMNAKIRETNIHVRMEKLKEKEAARVAKAMQKAAEKSAKAAAKAHELAVKRIKNAFRKLGDVAGRIYHSLARVAKWAAVAIIGIGTACTKMAMDVQDSEDFFEMAMGNMADATRKWSVDLSKALGLNQYEVRETVAVFNEMTTSMGMTDVAAAKLSQKYTKLAYDLVSYHPKVKTLEQASTVLQAALTGEREALKRLGYYYSENDVKLKALEMGYGGNIQKLTALQKLEVNDAILTEKMANVHGDLNRTLEQSKNVFRSLWSIIKETATGIGYKLLSPVTRVARAMRNWLKENKEKIIEWADVWIKRIEKVIGKVWELVKILTSDFSKGMGIFGEVVAIFFSALVDTALIAGLAAGRAFQKAFWVSKPSTVDIAERFKEEKYGLDTSKWPITGERITPDDAARIERDLMMEKLKDEINLVELLKATWEDAGRAMAKAIPDPQHSEAKHPQAGAATYAESRTEYLAEQAAKEREIWEAVDKQAIAEAALLEAKYQVGELTEEELANYDRVVAASDSALKKAKEMTDTLDVELGLLGLTAEARERAVAQMEFQKVLNDLIAYDNEDAIAFEERKAELMDAYLLKLDGVMAKEREINDLLDKSKEGWSAVGSAIDGWAKKAGNWGKQLGDVIANALDRAADAFTDMAMKGKADWKSLGAFICRELMKILVLQTMLAALGFNSSGSGLSGGGLIGLFGAGGQTPAQMHSFAGVAMPSAQHGGEVTQTGLAKVHKGEVFSGTKNEMGFGKPTVNVYNYGNDEVSVVNEDEHTLNLIIRAMQTDGSMRRAVSSIRK